MCREHLLGISGMQAQSSDDIQYLCCGSCPSKPTFCGGDEHDSRGMWTNWCCCKLVAVGVSSQHPKKAETARLPKNKPIRFGIPQLHEQVKTPACSVLIDRLTHAITFFGVSSELSAHAKTLHTSPVEVINVTR